MSDPSVLRQWPMERLEGVVAIPPGEPPARSASSRDGTLDVLKSLPADATRAGAAFHAAGWSLRRVADGPSAGHPLYFQANGQLKIATGLITLRLADHIDEAAVAGVLAAHGLTLVKRVGFRRHLYLVKPRDSSESLGTCARLQDAAAVLYAEPHLVEHVPTRSTHSAGGRSWHLRNTRADDAWTRSRGGGTVVAVIDYGFYLGLPDFAGSIVDAAGYFRRTPSGASEFVRSVEGMPGYFHGTFCAGIALGRPSTRSAGFGMAPEAKFLPIACERLDEVCSQLTLARAVAYAADPRCEVDDVLRGADVISCSLGPTRLSMNRVLEDALEYARDSGRNGLGTPVFWAVSNDDAPLSDDAVNSSGLTIPVGRSDKADCRRPCAYGPALAFLAPGEHVISVLQDGCPCPDSGTSYAAACAAAIAALMLSVDPTLTVREVVRIMQKTCDPVPGETVPNTRVGFGRVNAYRAVSAVALRDHDEG